MKVIEDKTAKQIRCKHCGSLLEVSKKDFLTETGEYCGYYYSHQYFYCPCCEEKNILYIWHI